MGTAPPGEAWAKQVREGLRRERLGGSQDTGKGSRAHREGRGQAGEAVWGWALMPSLGKGPSFLQAQTRPNSRGQQGRPWQTQPPCFTVWDKGRLCPQSPEIQAQSPLLPQDTHPWAGTRRWGGQGSKRHIFLPVGDKVLRTGPGHTADAQWMSAPVAVITKPGSSAASGVLPGCAVSTLSWPSLQGAGHLGKPARAPAKRGGRTDGGLQLP